MLRRVLLIAVAVATALAVASAAWPRDDDTPPPVSIEVTEGIVASDSGAPLSGTQVTSEEPITLDDAVDLLLGLVVPLDEPISANDAVAIELGPPPDSTPPAITPTVTGTLGQNGWYTSDVHVSWAVTDPQSSTSSSSGCDAADVTADTSGTTFTCAATSAGGTASQSVTVKRDATAPTASVTLARTPGSDSWYSAPVDWTAHGMDATSGIASCDHGTYAGPDDASASASGTCTDAAGNVSAPASISFRYDASPPAVSVAPTRAADHDGWYDHAVDWTVSGSDEVSGATCTAGGTYAGPDDATASLSGTCTNGAGLSASGSTSLRYDATAPTNVDTTPDRGPDANGWYNHEVVWTTHGDDATSGIASCTADGYSGPDTASASVTGSCTDHAGNETKATPVAFQYDATAPPIALTAPTGGATYVLRQSVAAAFACGPDLSGVASCTGTVANGSTLDTASVGTHDFAVTTSDLAGNSGSASASYAVRYASCGGGTVLAPIAADGSSVFKAGRTVPVKFQVCDASGASVGDPGVVASFKLAQTLDGTAAETVNQDPASTTPDGAFRWADGQWIFNLDTRGLAAGKTYVYEIGLNDGTTISVEFGLR